MLRTALIVILLCSQLTAPAMSGQFVCLAPSGCICIDSGPQSCTCCRVAPKAVNTCSCGCHEEAERESVIEEGAGDCTHIALGEYEPLLKGQTSLDATLDILSIELAQVTSPSTACSLARSSPLPDDSATLAVIATVVLRI